MNARPAPPLLSRRRMLERTAAGFGLLGLASVQGTPAAPAPPQRARRVIFLFMNGGPSHVDTFDPKPALARAEGKHPEGDLYKASKASGFMPSPFRFERHGQSGLEVSETLPRLAKVIDECCVVRSMQTDVPNHEPALIQMHTGNIQPIRPSFGSWLMYGLGSANRNLPGYVVLRPSPNIVVGPALWSSSFLPARFQATSIDTSESEVERMLSHIRNPRYGAAQQRGQVDLVRKLNRIHSLQRTGDPALEAEIESMETAFRMQIAATDAFDISKEPPGVQERYGDTPFARSCLMARRLAEAGVRCTIVYYTGKSNQPWDTHTNHNESHRRLCRDSDQAAAALIGDLKERGMLEETLVVWGGEFGRTPYSEMRNEKRPEGRDHHHTAFSMLLAGGGVRRGFAYGRSDEFGMNVVEDPMHIHDFHATLLHLMGLDHARLTYRYSGRDFRLTDVHGKVARGLVA